jgi:hypothetical protein
MPNWVWSAFTALSFARIASRYWPTHIDVRRHVDEMPGLRREARQAIRRRQTPLRVRPGLDGVDVEMIRARMVRVARHDEPQRTENFLRLRFGRAVARPVVPRHRVHQRLGESAGRPDRQVSAHQFPQAAAKALSRSPDRPGARPGNLLNARI